jgi:alanyl-tRNA synthetase
MTERLYYTDSYCARFSAHVIEQLTWEGHPAVVLDRTAFYPASGGQPADWGTLDGVAVLDVVAREGDGAVVHILDLTGSQKPARSEVEGRRPDGSLRPGSGQAAGSAQRPVEGVLDWARRFDHMQQHTGQHILSAAFEKVLNADTVGFHMGAEASTVDINVARLDSAALTQVEELANHVIWEDRPVNARFVAPGELATLPLRRPPTVEGPVRVVEIADPSTLRQAAVVSPPNHQGNADSGHCFDVNPCGGTHVAHTGEIGLIKIVRSERRGDETRVEFLCGGRALRDYRAKNALINQLAGRLTVGYWELEQTIERLQDEGRQLQQELRRARKQLLKAEAAELAEGALVRGPYRIVQRVWEGREPDELRALAQELAQRFSVVALLAGVGERVHLCFARAGGPGPDMAGLLREACAQLGGKGGGQPRMAQGSAPTTDAARVESVLHEQLLNLSPDSQDRAV